MKLRREGIKLKGTEYRDHKAVLAFLALKPGAGLLLKREEDNRFDPNAVAVLNGKAHVGYLPRDEAAYVGPLIDVGEQVLAVKGRGMNLDLWW